MSETKFNAHERARVYARRVSWMAGLAAAESLARLLREVYKRGVRDALRYKCEVCVSL